MKFLILSPLLLGRKSNGHAEFYKEKEKENKAESFFRLNFDYVYTKLRGITEKELKREIETKEINFATRKT